MTAVTDQDHTEQAEHIEHIEHIEHAERTEGAAEAEADDASAEGASEGREEADSEEDGDEPDDPPAKPSAPRAAEQGADRNDRDDAQEAGSEEDSKEEPEVRPEEDSKAVPEAVPEVRSEGDSEAVPEVRPEGDSKAVPQPVSQADSPQTGSKTGAASEQRQTARPSGAAPAPAPPGERPADRRRNRRTEATGRRTGDDDADPGGGWDDGLIARRVSEEAAARQAAAAAAVAVVETRTPGPRSVPQLAYDGPLRSRLDAMRELVGLSRARLDGRTLGEAGRVLDEAAARRRLSGQHTVVAIAGATGSGKSQLFNALAGVTISETGVRRPTTASPIACSWSDGAASLIDRLGIPGRLRRRPVQSPEAEEQLRGLVLVDLPDLDSAAVQHREQADRVLALVDAVIWVVDPEKYADAVLHERYLRPMAGHAEVMFVVLNQIDRLPGEAAEQVLDDLRRLLDEDGIALGEYGEPGASVLAVSALTGDGLGELRESLGQFVAERGAAARRISADLDAAAVRLWPVYATGRRSGLSERARDEFSARLADAVGATAAGEAAERAWLRNANRACGTPWLRLWRWFEGRRDPLTGRFPVRPQPEEEATARQRVEQAVRTVADRASAGLPAPWAQAVREAAVRGSQGLPEALDELAARAGLPPGRPPRPGWWPAAVLAQASMTLLQVVGGLWLVGQIVGVMSPNLGVPVLLMVAGIVGGPLVEWSCRMAARGPARRYGLEAERRLRDAAAGCGRARVLDPVAAELLRYREVREQYARVIGAGEAVGVPAGR
ncbi:GTPase [Streptomyces sp. NPDC006997]|uniref:GTPase n=1 Tax=Streptomyces sp. NPDC006997 TaxID=3155356 RepID=UPI0033D74757